MNEQANLQPACELEAIAYFNQVGRAEIERQLHAVNEAAAARFQDVCPFTLQGYTAFDVMTQEERMLRQKLTLALTLCVNEHAEARERITQRLTQGKRGRAA